MRLLADENFPGDAVDALRAGGHDVAWVRSDSPGSSDREILARAQSEGRLLLTFDKDFGELAFRIGLSAQSGIILCRFSVPSVQHAIRIITSVLASRTDWAGHFAVVEDSRIRLTRLPE
jgi:predicted nuclease of predicted toxin-antitoxin system